MKPQRIQLRRTKGWRMPANTVKVDRSTRWGNPFRADRYGAQEAVRKFREYIGHPNSPHGFDPLEVEQLQLRGKNLACWCRLCDQHRDGKPVGVECSECAPCHADILLGLANE